MKIASQVLFWLGIVCIPLAWLIWYMGPQLELARYVLADIADPAMKDAKPVQLRWPLSTLLTDYSLLIPSFVYG